MTESGKGTNVLSILCVGETQSLGGKKNLTTYLCNVSTVRIVTWLDRQDKISKHNV